MQVVVVTAILAVVLVLVLAFTGQLPGLFAKLPALGTTDLDTIKTNCQTDCANIKVRASTESDWNNSDYCTESVFYDINADGTVDDTESFYCWSPEIGVSCNVIVGGKRLADCGEIPEREEEGDGGAAGTTGRCVDLSQPLVDCSRYTTQSECTAINVGCEWKTISGLGGLVGGFACVPPDCTQFTESACLVKGKFCEWIS
jgi:hypothetical protein